MSNKTIIYYNDNANKYFETTVNVDMHENQERFLSYLEKNSTILDFGCGSGRDIKYFMNQGYNVVGIDGAEELCKLAREYTNTDIRCMNFLDFNDVNIYDGVWACASLLHLKTEEIRLVFSKLISSVVNDGLIYVSFKYGNFSGERDNRYFNDMTEDSFNSLINDINKLSVKDMWISSDVLPGRGEQKWLNIILNVTK